MSGSGGRSDPGDTDPRALVTLDQSDRIAALDAAARREWASQYVVGRQWTFFIRLSWHEPIREGLATKHVEAWAHWLQRRIPGPAVFAGLHNGDMAEDTVTRLHAHGLIYIPRQGAPLGSGKAWPKQIATVWYQRHWLHGVVFLVRYDPSKAERDGRHRTAEYVGKEVGTLMMIGTAPLFVPRRRR